MINERIAFVRPGIAELQPEPMPLPQAGEVLVKIAVSTVSSGTERANLVGETNISIYGKETAPVFPRYAGYSSSGVVEAVGEDVTGIAVGDRVALSWTQHARYFCCPAKNVTVIGEDVSFAEAALWHIATFPMAAIRKCRLEFGEAAIVMGLGVLGRIAVRLLRLAGAVPVIAADPVSEKREQALLFGADYALDPLAPDFSAQVKALTGGGAKVAIEVTGNGHAFDQVLDCMAPLGRVALLGCTRDPNFTIDYYRKIHGPGITVIGAHTLARPVWESSPGMWTLADDKAALLHFVRADRLHLSDMVEETVAPAAAPEVYARLAASAAFPLVQFDWRDRNWQT